jgi:hypothetical protein
MRAPMSRSRPTLSLILLTAIGFGAFVLFAFTIVGLVGEALIALSAAALVIRAVGRAIARR